ncbi:MAG: 3-deoxy-8-phosphooctulonate synthase [Muribaculaceae bacterium]|nr:3-deoxy-8-phosphooctulonate synthase [Muribaculaceae bacterium]
MTDTKFKLLAGPCVIESEENVMLLAHALKDIASRHDIDFYFKASWDKANRTKATNYRGPGMEEGLRILRKAKDEVGVKIVTDIHEPSQAEPVAQVADIIQIPAFLCRQTDLLHAAAMTGKMVNIKKAQFSSPEEMGNVVSKMEYYGCRNFMLCERGNCFGYNNLVVDMAGLVRLARLGYPVIFDATHSVQISGGGLDHGNSGKSEFVPYLAKAAVATGVLSGLFMEVHNDPASALCDGSCMLRLDALDTLLGQIMRIREITQE